MSARVIVEEKDNTIGTNRAFELHVDYVYPKKPADATDLEWDKFQQSLTAFSILNEAQKHAKKQWAGEPDYEVKRDDFTLPPSEETVDSLQMKWINLNCTQKDQKKIAEAEGKVEQEFKGILSFLGTGAGLSIPGVCMFIAGIFVPALSGQALSLGLGAPGLAMFVLGIGLMALSEVCSRKMSNAIVHKQQALDDVSKRVGLWSRKIEISSSRTRSRPNSCGSEEGKGSEGELIKQRGLSFPE